MLLAVLVWILALCFAVMYGINCFELKVLARLLNMKGCGDVSDADIREAVLQTMASYTGRST